MAHYHSCPARQMSLLCSEGIRMSLEKYLAYPRLKMASLRRLMYRFWRGFEELNLFFPQSIIIYKILYD